MRTLLEAEDAIKRSVRVCPYIWGRNLEPTEITVAVVDKICVPVHRLVTDRVRTDTRRQLNEEVGNAESFTPAGV